MRWIARRVMNAMMESFVGTGISVDEDGRLCLPDGLDPPRVHRFIELCTGRRYPHPRAAMHGLFRQVGVDRQVVGVLEQIIHEGGDVDLGAAARHGASLTAALPRLRRIPERFRDFLVHDLALAEPHAETLEKAVASARQQVAARLGCAADWDAILAHPEASGVTAGWRAASA